ncbi:MAG: hypothetical protein ABEK29_08470 [Bradymonadaceae bacterium]
MRAEGQGWPDIAEAVGYSHSTVRDYTTIPGFADLVEHFREQRRSDRVEEHWRQGAVEALDSLRAEVNSKTAQLDELRERVADGDIDAREASTIIDSLSGEVVRASKEYLRALGHTKAEQQRRKLEAEREVAEADEDTDAHLRRDIQDDLEEIDAVELANLYDKRFGDE